MANTIQIKRSSTPGNVPTLAPGEIGINDADDLLFWRDDQSVIRSTPLVEGFTGRRFRAFNDCISNSLGPDFTFAVSGTGAAFSSLATGSDTALGIVRAALGTTATGRAAIAAANFSVLRLGQGVAKFKAKVRIVSLSDATNTYSFRAGFIDSVTGESADGAFFRYTHSVNGGNFQAVTRSNNTETSTAVDTGIAAAANTWYLLEITVNAAGNSAVFRINGNVVATLSANIPTASGRETAYGIMALRSVGTAAFNCYDCDFIGVDYLFNSER